MKMKYDMREQTLYIIRGIPGAGKSTLGNAIKDALNKRAGYEICEEHENDKFFTKVNPKTGVEEYNWNPRRMGAAIHDCEDKVRAALEDGKDCVVANTFTKKSEFINYINMALELGVDYVVIKCDGGFQNLHSVPEETLKNMRERMNNNPFPGEIEYKPGDPLPI